MLSDLMEALKPEIVHAHHPFWMGDLALRMAGQYHVPLVFSYHTMFEQYTHYLPMDNEASKAFITELAAGYANLADQVIAPSASVRDVLLKRGVETPIDIVPTGVYVKNFEQGEGDKGRKRIKIPAAAYVVGHVGRLAPFFSRKRRNRFFSWSETGHQKKPWKNILRSKDLSLGFISRAHSPEKNLWMLITPWIFSLFHR